jgi:hypothetical protein
MKTFWKMRCPKCKGISYQRGNYEDDGEIFFPCSCDDCGKRFVEIFKFSRIEVYEVDRLPPKGIIQGYGKNYSKRKRIKGMPDVE